MKVFALTLAGAAIIGASQAYAEDPVPRDPETDHVDSCSGYGDRFFKLPGTDTCVSFSGYVWAGIGAENRGPSGSPPLTIGGYPGDPDREGNYTYLRGRLNFDARTPTEWGDLKSFVRLDGAWDGTSNGINSSSDGPIYLDQLYMEIAGFRVGYSESAWTQTIDGGVSNFPGTHSYGQLNYSYLQRALASYTHTFSDGYHMTVSLEEDRDVDNAAGIDEPDGEQDNNFTPDVVLKAGVNRDWGGAWAQFGYDEAYRDTDGYAAKLGMQYNIASDENSVRLVGSYSSNDNIYSRGQFDAISSEWNALASYQHVVNDELKFSVGGQTFRNLHDGLETTDRDAHSAELSVIWTPIQDLEIRGEVAYSKVDDLDGTVSSFLRIRRFF